MPEIIQEKIAFVKNVLELSLKSLLERDYEIFNEIYTEPTTASPDARILNRELHETCINHRLAYYIEELIRPKYKFLHVDIEYNRLYSGRKLLSVEGTDIAVRPDIIVHSRINTDVPFQHYLIIEAKKGEITPYDKSKVLSFLRDDRYSYLFGCTISYCNSNSIEATLYCAETLNEPPLTIHVPR